MRRFVLGLIGLALAAAAPHAIAQTESSPPAPTWQAGQEFDDCNGAAWCPRMIVVPAGSFTMGSALSEGGRDPDEGPQRSVSVQQFAVGKFEITWDQWLACVDRGGCTRADNHSDRGWGRGDRPVINVSWNEAHEYAQWLSRTTGHAYRLLTEAEWEYAARSGTTTAFSTGDSINVEQANFNRRLGRTQAVGAYAPNAFGLHDMHGNVQEWVQDCYASSYSGLPTDGSASEVNCQVRVMRGGSWYSLGNVVRSAGRAAGIPTFRDGVVGFRVARTLD